MVDPILFRLDQSSVYNVNSLSIICEGIKLPIQKVHETTLTDLNVIYA